MTARSLFHIQSGWPPKKLFSSLPPAVHKLAAGAWLRWRCNTGNRSLFLSAPTYSPAAASTNGLAIMALQGEARLLARRSISLAAMLRKVDNFSKGRRRCSG